MPSRLTQCFGLRFEVCRREARRRGILSSFENLASASPGSHLPPRQPEQKNHFIRKPVGEASKRRRRQSIRNTMRGRCPSGQIGPVAHASRVSILKILQQGSYGALRPFLQELLKKGVLLAVFLGCLFVDQGSHPCMNARPYSIGMIMVSSAGVPDMPGKSPGQNQEL